jgi:hypothetical protein
MTRKAKQKHREHEVERSEDGKEREKKKSGSVRPLG